MRAPRPALTRPPAGATRVVTASTAAHVQASDTDTYGYLWWRRDFVSGDRTYPAFYMSGNGGNKVVVVPSAKLVAVITSTFYSSRGMHQQTDKLLTDYILAALPSTLVTSKPAFRSWTE